MNYSRSKFSKHLPLFQLSYHHYSDCATCGLSGTGGSTTWKPHGNTPMQSEIYYNDF